MNILEYALNKKMFGGGGNGGNEPIAYHVSRVDELPTDAVDGSLAVVESVKQTGGIVLKEELTPTEIDEKVTFNCTKPDGNMLFFNRMKVSKRDGELVVTYYQTTGSIDVYIDGWEDDFYREILITLADYSNSFATWLEENVSGGLIISTLYSRENGEWVEKGDAQGLPEGYIKPEGTLEITENGTYDVTDKASVEVAVEGGGSDPVEIIDVHNELPTEGIKEGAVYRVTTGALVVNGMPVDNGAVHCVNGLPEVGEPCTNADMSETLVYYDVSSGIDYAYVDDMLSYGLGIPSGWYPPKDLFEVAGFTYGGVVHDITESMGKDDIFMVIYEDHYTYKDGWRWFVLGSTGKDPLSDFVKFRQTCAYMFSSCGSLTEVPLFDTRNVTDMSAMFYGCSSLTEVPLFDTGNVMYMDSMFSSCGSLTEVPLLDTRNVTNMSDMFGDCYSLTEVPLFDTRNVTDMNYMFGECGSLTEVPLFDTRNVTDMSAMFYGCSSLTEVPLFDTGNVMYMKYMVSDCYSLTEVPLFDTRNVTDMSYMFSNCYSLTEVPLFDTRNVMYMDGMFSSCGSLTEVPLFDTRNVTDMSYMFYHCLSLTDIRLRNIKTNLQVGSGTAYGHLLTVDSLVHLIRELRDTGSEKTFTVGSANLEKLANVYVKPIDITDEMRAEDDLIDEKLPFVVCESTDEGACLITEYVTFKNWKIQ